MGGLASIKDEIIHLLSNTSTSYEESFHEKIILELESRIIHH
jgi:hypothetical protein